MSTKKQISGLCRLYSVYEEIPEEFVDETVVDSYLYHNIFDISLSQHQIVRVDKGSNKKSFASKVFRFCDSKWQQRFILKEEVGISRTEIESLLDSLGEFLKALDETNKVSQIPSPKLNFWDWIYKSKKWTVQSLLQGFSWAFEQTNLVIVPVWDEQDLRLFHQKVWTLRWSIHSHRSCQLGLPRNQTPLQESIFCCVQVWHFWEQLQCEGHSPLIVGMTITLLFSLGKCTVQIQSVWLSFACTKRLLNLSAEAIINVRNARLCATRAIFHLKIKQIFFPVLWSRGLHFWREPKISSRCYWRYVLSNM